MISAMPSIAWPVWLSVVLPIEVTSGIWNWEKLWNECGSPAGPGVDS